ncbi:MAG: type ISP restriction/modification enzyme [Chitinophagales bacterium]
MTTSQYLDIVNNRFKSGISREHSYRTDLEQLIRTLVPDVDVTNEPANVTDCGNPDYVISKKKIPIGYIEAKDIGKDLNAKGYKEQFTRYKNALDNLIITDYIWFQFFQDGELIFEVRIAEIENDKVKPFPENFNALENQLKDFCTFVGQTIKSSAKLAKMMASKARLFQGILEAATTSDEKSEANTSLQEQYKAFQQILIHDITPKAFADIYAQTLAYGMFAARLHDETLSDFSRQEAAELIPKSNPFLRKLFQYIAGYDIDERIITPVNNLAEVFRATDIKELLKDFGKSTQQNDPIIHFYETFLSEYDAKLRKARGVWYTPEPVVNFIVRAVDDILKTEFDLKDGLADTTKTKIKVKVTTADKRSKTGFTEMEKEVHKVQILDPATGTGTFLAEVIRHIYNKRFKAMQGVWSSYVENDLIPRLNGFELLMASYAMAHLKLDLLLKETGFVAKKDQRFKVFLTNSLEEHHPDTGTLFANWLSTEANEANYVKRDTPVMCIIGNPPYSVSSTNKGDWIETLVGDYKRNLNEKSYNSLSDDYVKFIRYGQYYIDKNGSGILAYISNNSFIDGITHRKMREHLLMSFDKIYIIDLHGNAKKKEISPDGSPDQNVFDIMQGVSINIFIKSDKKLKKELGNIFHCDFQGKRDYKYNILSSNSIASLDWDKLENVAPHYFFVPKNFDAEESYNKGFSIASLMKNLNPGVESGRDDFFIDYTKGDLKNKIENVFNNKNSIELKSKFGIKNTSSFKFESNLDSAIFDVDSIVKINYRPFDLRYTYYDNKLQRRASYDTFSHIISGSIGLIIKRGFDEINSAPVFITNSISDRRGWTRAGMQGAESITPLYLYPETNEQQTIEELTERTPNLNLKIVNQIAKQLGLTFTNEKEPNAQSFAPIDILDYIYAVLHSPTYREKYKEFLKIDFPRVPYPKDAATFWQLVALGKQIREIHLLESDQTENYITTYPKDGDNVVTRKMSKNSIGYEPTTATHGKVWINDEQYFDNVPLVAWEFYIGGYQPAQKWLKDRTDRELSFDDILHYQKIIVALNETNRLMQEIDKVDVE